MFNEPTDPGVLRPKELEAVYGISRAVAQSTSVDRAMDEITNLTRPVFIFDAMVLYSKDIEEPPSPNYVRVIGRGSASEGDLSWGEAIAQEVLQSSQTILKQEKDDGWEVDRLNERFYLGLPLKLGEQVTGAIVFCRFGGPVYTKEQIHLAEFIAAHIAQLIGRQYLVQRVASLEAERRLERLQQDFIATISHELNTPLGFIKGYATTLLREDTTWDEATRREFLLVIDEEADRLRDLIDNLLDSSRLQAGTLRMHFQPVRFDSLLRDIVTRVSSNNHNIHIQLEILEANLRCQADPTRLAQVLENLLSNAVKYAPGSNVIITLNTIEGRAHIQVSDTGPGIAPEHLDNMFKRFYRVPDKSSNVRGTGLGLFISRQIIRAHSGEISVESKVGSGTTFHIYLPYAQTVTESNISMEEGPQ